ncbi:winged helix-turn-helix domain-containing protein [Streptomyces sp. M41]|uniref:winged helix-turn-helix domain-containing protein n=1 Tax=Streptomyces sp. M41 TaxID=3059412 RepID=UPI00374CEE81
MERLRTEAVAYRERAEAVVERLRAEALAERDRTRGASEGRHARTTAEHGSTPTATEPGRTQAAAEHGRRQAVAGHGRTQAVAEPAVAPPPASYEYTLSASDEAAPPPSDRSARPNPDGDVSSAPGSSPASPPGEGPGPLVVDRRTRRVWVGESPVTLTPKEFELLALLAEDAGAVYSRQQILDRVWDPHYEGPTKTLDVHVASLRRKLGDPAWIQTLRGVGFRLAVQTEPDGRRVPSP